MEQIVQTGGEGASGIIVARLVTDDSERMRCLPDVAGEQCVLLEHTIYDMLRMMCAHHDGGLWDFFKLSNGGFYMAPEAMGEYRLVGPGNGFEGGVSAKHFGLIATAMAYSHLSFRQTGSCFSRAYVQLSEFIHQQDDRTTVLAALD